MQLATHHKLNTLKAASRLAALRLTFLLCIASIAGCQANAKKWSHADEFLPREQAVESAPEQDVAASPAKSNPTNKLQSALIVTGDGPRINRIANPSVAPQKPTGGNISLRFSDTPIREVVKIIIGDYLNEPYVVADDVQGSVSLNNDDGLAKSDLLPVLETLLSSVDARLLKEGQSYKVVAGAEKRLSFNSKNLEIIPLRYIDAAEFAKITQDYQVSTTVIAQGNLLALNGPSNKINQIKNLAKTFDVNWLKGKTIGLFPVINASAVTVKRELLQMFGDGIDSDVAGATRIVAVERSNTIMVIAAQRDYVKLIGDWVDRLDKIGGGAEQKFFIYRVQNGRAVDLAELLRHMFGSQTTAPNSLGTANQEFNDAPSQQQSNKDNNRKTDSGDFRVIADESTNSLIITGSPHHFQSVRQAMEQLDSTPMQVLVEARIMELTLTDDLQYGLEWFLRGSRANSNTSGTLDFGTSGINVSVPGFSYVIERAGEVRAALNGLADDSRLKVLSSPSLMVMNNQTASILVGDEVPIPTRQAVSTISPDAPTVNEIEYRNTGILLTVSPRVNSGGMVTMDISQEVSSVANNTTSQIDAPTIQQRKLNSTISIRSGQTVVLGGLIREQDSTSDSGVPLLKDIPGLGKLFSTTNNRVQRTELVVLITPRVVLNQNDTDAITQEYQSKFVGLRPIRVGDL